MAQYILLGLVSGSIYALAALGLVSTYVASGVLNFAYGAFAYFVARLYYFLNTQHHWAIVPAAVLSILVFSPAAGFILWATILRGLSRASTLIKVGATIGISVALPAVADLAFGVQVINTVPGLAPQPEAVYHLLGISITLDQVIVLACLVAVLVLGGIIIRFTTAGVLVRAIVDSDEMARLSGVNPQRVSAVVWMVSFLLAGLAGVLVAPTLGLQSNNFTFLLGTAFASVVVAKLRYPGRAVLTALALGVVTALIQKWAPSNSSLAQELIPAVPFAFVFAFILFGSRGVSEEHSDAEAQLGVRLAQADEQRLVTAADPGVSTAGNSLALVKARLGRFRAGVLPVALVAITAIVLALLSSYWIGVVGDGIAFGIAFLSFTLLTGDGGFISLAQITFAGFGAVAVGQFSTEFGLSPIEALAVATALALIAGLLVGFVTVRLGYLYVALITLTLGLLMDNLVFALPRFTASGEGVFIGRPGFALSDRSFAYFALVVFVLVALFVWAVRRSTTGLAISAARWSAPATRISGLSTTAIRALLVGLGGGIAALGGGLLAMFSQVALPTNFVTGGGLVWLAVSIAVGIRSSLGALAAGISFTVIPGLFTTYLPTSWTPVPTLLFGLAAIGMVRQPDGIASDLTAIGHRLRRLRPASRVPAKAAVE
jgi:branched-chain amino acid transport system permease protein